MHDYNYVSVNGKLYVIKCLSLCMLLLLDIS